MLKQKLLKYLSLAMTIATVNTQAVCALSFDAVSGLDTATATVTVSGVADCHLTDRPVAVRATVANGTEVYRGQIMTGENGSFSLKFRIPNETPSGNITVTARGYQEEASVSMPAFWYASEQELTALKDGLNNGTISLETVLSDATDSNFINLNLKLSAWETRLAAPVAGMLQGVTYANAGEIKEKVYAAAVITLLSEKSEADAVSFLKATDDGGIRLSMLKLNPTIEALFLSKDEIALFAVEAMKKDAVSILEFVTDFEKKIAVGAVNAADSWGVLNQTLEAHSQLLGLEANAATALTQFRQDSSVQAAVGKALWNQKPFQNEQSLTTAFITAVTNATQVVVPPVGGGFVSSGGGGGGGGVSIAKPLTPEASEEQKHQSESSASYQDISKNHWAYHSILAMSEAGIVNGDGRGSFFPEKSVTREEFVKMLMVAFNLRASSDSVLPYNDVKPSDWFYPYVAAARESGVVMGVTGEAFGTGQVITREQMAAICYRVISISEKAMLTAKKSGFTDNDTISTYAVEAVNYMAENGILNGMGDGSFQPKGTVTRAQAAHVIFNLYRNKGGVSK